MHGRVSYFTNLQASEACGLNPSVTNAKIKVNPIERRTVLSACSCTHCDCSSTGKSFDDRANE